jgi:hypothetical protein
VTGPNANKSTKRATRASAAKAAKASGSTRSGKGGSAQSTSTGTTSGKGSKKSAKSSVAKTKQPSPPASDEASGGKPKGAGKTDRSTKGHKKPEPALDDVDVDGSVLSDLPSTIDNHQFGDVFDPIEDTKPSAKPEKDSRSTKAGKGSRRSTRSSREDASTTVPSSVAFGGYCDKTNTVNGKKIPPVASLSSSEDNPTSSANKSKRKKPSSDKKIGSRGRQSKSSKRGHKSSDSAKWSNPKKKKSKKSKSDDSKDSAEAKGAIPRSILSTGKFNKNMYKKNEEDKSHKAHYEVLAMGILAVIFERYNKEEEPFLGPCFKHFKENPSALEAINAHAIYNRRGENGTTYLPQAPGSQFPYRVIVILLGQPNCTRPNILSSVERVVTNFNSRAVEPTYKFPVQIRVGKDLTNYKSPRPLDTYLLDKDLLPMMDTSYPDHKLLDLIPYRQVMKSWWTDIDYGRMAMEQWQVPVINDEIIDVDAEEEDNGGDDKGGDENDAYNNNKGDGKKEVKVKVEKDEDEDDEEEEEDNDASTIGSEDNTKDADYTHLEGDDGESSSDEEGEVSSSSSEEGDESV